MASIFVDIKNNVSFCIDKCKAVYNWALSSALSLKAMHTYYDDPDKFIDIISDKYLHLSAADLAEAKRVCPLAVAGADTIKRVARRRIHYHAFMASLMTFACALPLNWLMWPLMIVDIVYFQMQVFAISQELYILYKPKNEYADMKFDYTTLANISVRMEGTLIKNKIVKQAKKGVGKVGKWLVKRSARVLRGPLQILMRQMLKWFGVTLTKDMVEMGLNVLLSVLCSFVGGLISYWLFVPMAHRLEKELTADGHDETVRQ